MKISLNWIRELLNNPSGFSDEQIISSLEKLGYEIESINQQGSSVLSKVQVVKILDIKKHPNADKLALCELTDGINTYNVVCGAPNVYIGMVAPYAPVGSVLSDGTKIEVRKIRGVESRGMLCSAKELGISDDHSGILELDESFKLGDSLDKYFNDIIVEISTPANRYDCLGHIGIAKELAIKLGVDFRLKEDTIQTLESKLLPFFNVKITSKDLCKRYIAINIQSVNNKVKLPFYIIQRLSSCGIRSINPLVDISNYVMLEVGHSVHIFDFDKLTGGKIIVRCAKNNESILALDGKNYVLDESVIIISDEEKLIAIAGIIGGENSCVDENTKNVVIESAVFNRSMIRLARKKLDINTEASYRFERGSGWKLCELAALKTQKLILKYCGGEVVKFTDEKDIEYYKNLTSYQSNGINVNLDFISSLLGINVEIKDFIELMRKLDAEVVFNKDYETTKKFVVLPPIDRQDIKFQADIAEEIARFIGYENIPDTLPSLISPYIGRNKLDILKDKIIDFLLSYGLNQAINYSLCSERENEVVKDNETKKILIFNPVSKEYTELKLTLFSSLLKNIITNYNNQTENSAFFELGKIYYRDEKNYIEEERIGIITHGEFEIHPWKKDFLEYDFYFINGLVENLLKTLKINYVKNFEFSQKDTIRPTLKEELLENYIEYLDENNRVIATTFEIKKEKLKLKLPKKIFCCEIYLDIIKDLCEDIEVFYKPLPKYPFVLRDLCLSLPNKDISYKKITEIIKNFVSKNFPDTSIEIKLADYYEKDKLLSLTLSMKIQSALKTLKDEEVNNIIGLLIEELKKYNIDIRR